MATEQKAADAPEHHLEQAELKLRIDELQCFLINRLEQNPEYQKAAIKAHSRPFRHWIPNSAPPINSLDFPYKENTYTISHQLPRPVFLRTSSLYRYVNANNYSLVEFTLKKEGNQVTSHINYAEYVYDRLKISYSDSLEAIESSKKLIGSL